jgi:hypothetical protein
MEETKDSMREIFIPQLNEFTELQKQTHKVHVEYIMSLSKWQNNLLEQNQKLKERWKTMTKPALVNDKEYKAFIDEQLAICNIFAQEIKKLRVVFGDHIEDTNFMLGKISNHWGGYVESIGVRYLVDYLRKQYGTHTFFEKFRRYWHKSRNVEIDLLATSETHVYIVEAKSQLKIEHLAKFQKMLDKFKENVPQYGHLIPQPILFCIHTSDEVLAEAKAQDWWILRYKDFDRENPSKSFEWLSGQDN